MVAESVAILAVCFLLLVTFMRSKYSKATITILPIAVTPAAHLLFKGLFLFAKSGSFLDIRVGMWLAFIDVIALGITCGIIVGLSRSIEIKRVRRVYLGIMLTYSVLIGWAYVFDTLKVFLQ